MLRIRKGNNQIILSEVLILLILLCGGQYLGISAFNLVLTALIIIIACVANVDDLFVIMYATLPLYNIINYKIGTYSMHYLIIGLFVLKYFAVNKISAYKLLAFIALFLLRIFAMDFVLLTSWSILILPLVLTIGDTIWQRNINRIIKWMNITMIISCATGYAMMATENSIYSRYGHGYLYVAGERVTRFTGVTGDSVVFGETCALMIAINLTYCYFHKKNRKSNVIAIVIFCASAALSYSKAALLCIVFILFFFAVLYAKNYAQSRKKVLKLLLIAAILIALLAICFTMLINYSGNSTVVLGYIDRFTRDDLSTGRIALWNEYIKMFTSNPINLIIPVTSKILKSPIWNTTTSSYTGYAHNLYLETIGVFGWCAAIIIFCWILRKLYKFVVSKNKLIGLLPIVTLLLFGFSCHGNLEYQFYLQLALALSFMQPGMNEVLIGGSPNADSEDISLFSSKVR